MIRTLYRDNKTNKTKQKTGGVFSLEISDL